MPSEGVAIAMRAAILALRQHAPSRIVVGVPVASPDACADLSDEVDEIICAVTPEPFSAVGLWYDNFDQTSDAEVKQLLQSAAQLPPTRDAGIR